MADKGVMSIVWMIIWALLLVFIALWIGTGVTFLYMVLYIFVPCVPALKDFLNILHKGILLPYFCSDNIVNGRDIGEGFNFIVSGGPSA